MKCSLFSLVAVAALAAHAVVDAVGFSYRVVRDAVVATHSRRFDFVASLDPVVGVVGGGDHSRLIRQFNTPGMRPR